MSSRTGQDRTRVEVIRSSRSPYFSLVSRRQARAASEALLSRLGQEGAGLELQLTGDLEIEELNRRFLGVVGPTNVLGFPAREGDFLGCVVLSMQAVLREAHLYRQSRMEHFSRMLAHGILHLSGYEHGPVMEELTEDAALFLRDMD